MKMCERKDNEFYYVQVTKDNLPDVITFLGKDFVAITNGKAINYGGAKIQYNANEEVEPNPTDLANFLQGMVVFESNGEIRVAVMGDYIVQDPLIGYIVIKPHLFDQFYKHIGADDGSEG